MGRATRTWGLAPVLALASLAVFVPSSHAGPPRQILYVDARADPNDRPIDHSSCCQQDPDIRTSTRTVLVDADGRRWLSIRFRAYEILQTYWKVVVHLDARGSVREEGRMVIADLLGDLVCAYRARGAEDRRGQGVFPLQGDGATCRIPLAWLAPTKEIRWRLFSPAFDAGTAGPRMDERAPDHGWYP